MSGDERNQRRARAEGVDDRFDAELRARADGEALRAIYEAIPPATATSPRGAEAEARQREAAWARLEARLHDPARVPFVDDVPPPLSLVKDEAAAPSDTVVSRWPRRPWLWSAAATLLVAICGVAEWGTVPVERRVADGAPPAMEVLPDGSRLWLAPGAHVTYSRRLGWPAMARPAERVVRLDGEAFFEVARDGRPFRVLTSDAAVQVLGTRFGVRAADGERGSRVQVEEGRVAVSAPGGRVELRAGQATVVAAAGLAVREVPVQRVAAWRRGGLAALDEPLGEVLAELSRRFGVEVEIDATVDQRATVSLFYPVAPRADVVLGDLCTAQGLTYARTSRGFVVSGGTRAP